MVETQVAINNSETAFITAPRKYSKLPGHADRVYDSICKVLSERREQVNWEAFTSDDWNLMASMAKAEGVGPLLYWNFKDDAWPQEMPVQLRTWLQQSYYQTAARNQVLFQELERILAAFEEANIPVIVLKGAALAQTVYPDPGLRPMGDLDLLIPKENLEDAVCLAQKIGFQEHSIKHQPRLNRAVGHHIDLVKGSDTNLELHWKLIGGEQNKPHSSADWAWRNTNVIHPGKCQTFTISAHIIYLSVHLALQHGLVKTRLIWLFDVYWLLQQQKYTINWNYIFSNVKELGWIASLEAVLSKISLYFIYTPPTHIINELKDAPSEDRQLVNNKTKEQTRSESFYYYFTIQGNIQKVKLIFAYLFPSPDWIRYHYQPQQDRVWFLYYPYRWGIFSWDIIKTLWNKINNY